MKKIFVLFVVFILCFAVFAEDSEPAVVKVSRRNPTALTLDFGGFLDVALDDSFKCAGIMVGGSITPIMVKKIVGGFRAEACIMATKDILSTDNRKKELKALLTGTFIGIYPLEKSFEIYGGGGARYKAEEFESLTDFKQSWGLVLQGGGRGRLNDFIGVGVEANLFFDISRSVKSVDGIAYFSFEF